MEVQTNMEYVNLKGLTISKMKYTSEPVPYKIFMVCLVQTYTIILLVSANTSNALKTTYVYQKTVAG